MGQYHGHSHEGPLHGKNNRTALIISLIITASIMVFEFLGGLFTNSLALLSDAGHMLSDTTSLGLSLFAMIFALKPPSPQKTYGFYRFEILAAFFNGLTLFLIASLIIWEAYGRFFAPPSINSPYMISIAAFGLIANLLSALVLLKKGDMSNSINLRSAYLHILGDALGSVGAIIAGVLMYYFSWYTADPIISVIVALLILKSAWNIINESVNILLEGTPPTINWLEVRESLRCIDGVQDVHDLHIWTITSGRDSLTCHLLIEVNKDAQIILREAINIIRDQFQINHTTIQIEIADFNHETCLQTAFPSAHRLDDNQKDSSLV
ncbi:cation diffusion facilitator family transporter [Pelosinus propionicus]|uniref:Cobalt-zinc-cadmium efflux system protein n=1 Tax=Pelosinus propionicus DSM 13327 TaxID=1123291 RepID=A0A1I4MS45_9FIRM|nr:cation diffusion facilitator family transporter [Pelosinus propionicus]SFM06114.1 cobalt-zinc-cadmium efflux system protein [Pelosinus propionicus DSM 13327]